MIPSIEKPLVLTAILAIIPAVIYTLHRFKNLASSVSGFYQTENDLKIYKKLKASILLRTFLRAFAWIFAVCAYAGISWGTKNIPIQKNGCSVCLVFDISYSMTAKDSLNGKSRLEATTTYAKNLISQLEGTSFSAVLAKGDGFVAIPATEDIFSLNSLLENLSPSLMTSAGSSIGKGIQSAFNSFPPNSARTNFIWVFTDGDETDNQLESALNDAVRFGIPLTIVGFGSKKGREILAGDGKTKVQTFLRSDYLKKLIDKTNKTEFSKFRKKVSKEESNLLRYVDASESGSAYMLLNQIYDVQKKDADASSFDYESVEVKRHGLFIFLSAMCIILSFIIGEFHIKHRPSFIAVSLMLLSLTSCQSEKKVILHGAWNWYQGNFKTATADFLNAIYDFSGNEEARQYAIFDLASTYISLEEYEGAVDRLNQLNLSPEKTSSTLISQAYYNYGIIYERQNNFATAAEYFKKAVLINPENLNAKINLELCNAQRTESLAQNAESQMQGAGENHNDSPLKNELFNLIRENDNNQWKKLQSNSQESSVLDY